MLAAKSQLAFLLLASIQLAFDQLLHGLLASSLLTLNQLTQDSHPVGSNCCGGGKIYASFQPFVPRRLRSIKKEIGLEDFRYTFS